MKNKSIILLLTVLISLIELISIKPIIPSFYQSDLSGKIIYVIGLYGYPIWIIIPIVIIVIPFAFLLKSKNNFIHRWFDYSQNTFLVISIIILFLNSLLVIQEYILGNEIFPLIKYSEIKGFTGDTDDLKTGEFETNFSSIERFDNIQYETYYENNNKVKYDIKWLSNTEYKLISEKNNQILDLKITNNTPSYYECYLKVGEFSEYRKVTKTSLISNKVKQNLPLDYSGYIQIKKSVKYNEDIRVYTTIEVDLKKDTLYVGDTLKMKVYLKNATYFRELAKHEDLKYEEIFEFKTFIPSTNSSYIDKSNIHNDTAYVNHIVIEKKDNKIEKRRLDFIINTHFEDRLKNKYDSFFVGRMEYFVK